MCINKDIPKTPTPQQYGPVPGRCRAGYKKNKTSKLCIKKSLQTTIKASVKTKPSRQSIQTPQSTKTTRSVTKKNNIKKTN